MEEKNAQGEAERAEAVERAETAEKRASNAGNETMLKYKLSMDLIQQQLIIARECVERIAEEDPDKAGKMDMAMKQVLGV
jgi:hypothetical protein